MNIYVGNMPKSTTEAELKVKFEAFGEVEDVKLIKDHFTGELRGFGFVRMSSTQEAQNAIKTLNGSAMGGRTLTVNEARNKGKQSRRF